MIETNVIPTTDGYHCNTCGGDFPPDYATHSCLVAKPAIPTPVNQVLHGDALAMLRTLADNSVDSICCDPPAGINFMNKAFDSNRGGRDSWVAWLTAIMREALRVLKPGGHAFVWALPRTSHWTALALEDAGFEIRDEVSHLFGGDSRAQAFMASLNDEQRNAFAQVIDGMGAPAALLHLFGSGFPKSANISAMIDKMMGKEPEVIGERVRLGDKQSYVTNGSSVFAGENTGNITKPATPEGEKWQGWHSALKPSHETWWLCRKPLAEPSIAANVLKYSTGALNIDASRIGVAEDDPNRRDNPSMKNDTHLVYGKDYRTERTPTLQGKRFPANTLLSHSWQCVPLGVKRVHVNDKAHDRHNSAKIDRAVYDDYSAGVTTGYADSDGMEHVEAFQCAEDCPIRALDEMSGVRKSGALKPYDTNSGNFGSGYTSGVREVKREASEGTASRYFQNFHPDDMPPFLYTSKASRAERSKGCEALPERDARVVHNQNCKVCVACGKHLPNSYTMCTCGGDLAIEEVSNPPRTNSHPTVKSLSLMKYLISMITPPNGIVLDMFAGSGTTGVAAVQCGFRYILIEQEQEYVDIIRARLAHAHREYGAALEQEYECAEDCPVRVLGEQSGVRKSDYARRTKGGSTSFFGGATMPPMENLGYNDTGTAARFFQTFPPDSLFAGMEDVSGEQKNEQDEERVT